MLVEILGINAPLELDFEPYWFNTEGYSAKQPLEGLTYYYNKNSRQAFIRFSQKGSELHSPGRAPFGSLEFTDSIEIDILYDFVKEWLAEAKKTGIKKIQITSPPECYGLEHSDRIDEVLIHAGFRITSTELNYHLDTGRGSFESLIHISEKRRLKKCLEAGFTVGVETNPDYAYVHKLISDCRKRKGHPLSMNKEEFETMFKNFPHHYIVFTVKDKERIIAAAIGVKVRSDILYNFLPADDEVYLSYSPIVLLNKGMYDYCQQNMYKIYDLGIATAGGVRNEGLIRFKEHLGGELSYKYSYELIF